MTKIYSNLGIIRTMIKESFDQPHVVFNCDFAAMGRASEKEAARVLISIFQKIFFNYKSPVIYIGENCFIYMQRNQLLRGFLTQHEDVIYVGELSTDNIPIQVSGKIQECSACGNRELPVAGVCGKCKSSYHSVFSSMTIPIYSFPRQEILFADQEEAPVVSHSENMILVAEKEFSNPRAIVLNNMY